MTLILDPAPILADESILAGAAAIAEAFGLGDSAHPSNDWPTDDGDTTLAIEIEDVGYLLLGVNNDVAGRLSSNTDRLRDGFAGALDAICDVSSAPNLRLGELVTCDQRPGRSAEIFDGKRMTALFGVVIEEQPEADAVDVPSNAAGMSDGVMPAAGMPGAGMSDGVMPPAGMPGAGMSDGVMPPAGMPGAGMSDGVMPAAGMPNGMMPGAGMQYGGMPAGAAPAGAAGPGVSAPAFRPDVLAAGGPMYGAPSGPLSLLHEVEMDVTVELGRTRMPIRELLSLQPGMVVELDHQAGTPIDVLVNGRLIAVGEVVVIDEEFGIRITEIVDRGNRA